MKYKVENYFVGHSPLARNTTAYFVHHCILCAPMRTCRSFTKKDTEGTNGKIDEVFDRVPGY